jgi:hypothetical protein
MTDRRCVEFVGVCSPVKSPKLFKKRFFADSIPRRGDELSAYNSECFKLDQRGQEFALELEVSHIIWEQNLQSPDLSVEVHFKSYFGKEEDFIFFGWTEI